jgi:hypothetical protein
LPEREAAGLRTSSRGLLVRICLKNMAAKDNIYGFVDQFGKEGVALSGTCRGWSAEHCVGQRHTIDRGGRREDLVAVGAGRIGIVEPWRRCLRLEKVTVAPFSLL